MTQVFDLNKVNQTVVDGEIVDLQVTNYDHIKATLKIRKQEDNPITVDFPELYGFDPGECPIKLGDWVRVTINVERYDDPKHD